LSQYFLGDGCEKKAKDLLIRCIPFIIFWIRSLGRFTFSILAIYSSGWCYLGAGDVSLKPCTTDGGKNLCLPCCMIESGKLLGDAVAEEGIHGSSGG